MSFRQEYLCEFLDDGVTFFHGFEKCMTEDTRYSDTGGVAIGVDFSASGEDRTVVTKINGKGQVWQKVVDGTLDMRYREIASIIMSARGLTSCLMEKNGVGDPMGNEVLKLLDARSRRLTGWFTTTNSSKDEAVGALAVALADRRLTYSDRALYDELRAFRCSWSKTGKPLYGGVGEHDDRVMSLAIAWRAARSERRGVSIGFAKMKNTVME